MNGREKTPGCRAERKREGGKRERGTEGGREGGNREGERREHSDGLLGKRSWCIRRTGKRRLRTFLADRRGFFLFGATHYDATHFGATHFGATQSGATQFGATHFDTIRFPLTQIYHGIKFCFLTVLVKRNIIYYSSLQLVFMVK